MRTNKPQVNTMTWGTRGNEVGLMLRVCNSLSPCQRSECGGTPTGSLYSAYSRLHGSPC